MLPREESAIIDYKEPCIVKTCFILIPDNQDNEYENGHFKRVFDYLINPACQMAGYTNPVILSDEMNGQPIRLKHVDKIKAADLIICDLSTHHPAFMYQLGIRQALHLPIILLRDSKTKPVFDNNEWHNIVYNKNLRVDTIETKVLEIARAIAEVTQQKVYNTLLAGSENLISSPQSSKSANNFSLISDAINSINLRIESIETKINIAKTEAESTIAFADNNDHFNFIIRYK